MVPLVAGPKRITLNTSVVSSHRMSILVQFVITKVRTIQTQVLLFSSYGMGSVTSPLSQMSCKVVMAIKTIGVVSQILTISIHSSLTCLGHERV